MKSHRRRNSEGTAVFLHDASLSAFILGAALGFSPTQSAWFVHSRHVAANAECFLPDGTLAALNPTLRTLAWTTTLCAISYVCVCFPRFTSFSTVIIFRAPLCVCAFVHVCACLLSKGTRMSARWLEMCVFVVIFVTWQIWAVTYKSKFVWHDIIHPQWRSKARRNDTFCQNWVTNEIGALRPGISNWDALVKVWN